MPHEVPVANETMQAVQGQILERVKVNSIDKSYRSLLFDITDMKSAILEKGGEIDMSLSAAALSERIKFHDPKEYINITSAQTGILSKPNTTALIDIELPRIQLNKVFKLRKFTKSK